MDLFHAKLNPDQTQILNWLITKNCTGENILIHLSNGGYNISETSDFFLLPALANTQ